MQDCALGHTSSPSNAGRSRADKNSDGRAARHGPLRAKIPETFASPRSRNHAAVHITPSLRSTRSFGTTAPRPREGFGVLFMASQAESASRRAISATKVLSMTKADLRATELPLSASNENAEFRDDCSGAGRRGGATLPHDEAATLQLPGGSADDSLPRALAGPRLRIVGSRSTAPRARA